MVSGFFRNLGGNSILFRINGTQIHHRLHFPPALRAFGALNVHGGPRRERKRGNARALSLLGPLLALRTAESPARSGRGPEEGKEKEEAVARASSLARTLAPGLFRVHNFYRMRTASESRRCLADRATTRCGFASRAIPYRLNGKRNSSHARSGNRWTARSNRHSGAQPTEDAETGGPRCE